MTWPERVNVFVVVGTVAFVNLVLGTWLGAWAERRRSHDEKLDD